MKREKYSPPKDWLGIRSFIARMVALTPEKFFIGHGAFKLLILSAPLGKVPVLSWFYKKIILMSPSDYSQGYSIPLNVDASKAIQTVPVNLDIGSTAQKVPVPADLMKKAVREAKVRAIMHKCICRDSEDCKDYPTDVGCIFLGDAARVVVKNRIARIATAKECIAHIEKANSHGLSGQALWVEAEKYLWGIENHKATQFLELCFCCPCCCTGFRFADRADHHSRSLFHRSSGWVATIDADSCISCMACHEVCPRHAIDIEDETPAVNADCGGCGLCVPKCKTDAITLHQVSELKDNLKDYFDDIDFDV